MGFLNRLSIQSKLLLVLLLTSFLSLLVTGTIGYSSGRAALTHNIFNQLTSLRSAKANELESYIQFTRNHVLTLSETPTMIQALKEFKAAYRQLNARSLLPSQQAKLEAYYRDDFVPKLALTSESTPAIEPFLPQTPAAKYLQYHYIAANPKGSGQERDLDDAGDGSEYSRLHRRYQPLFRSIAERFGYDDIILVDVDTGEVVYTVAKQVDLGTNLRTGPFQASVEAEAVEKVRKARDPNFVTNVDLEPYRPSYGAPTAFTATTVFDGSDFIGALLFQAPIGRINQIMSANQAWKEVGLGETGEVFLVGPDGLLRSEPRLFIENKESYFETLKAGGRDEREVERIRRLDTAILNQKSTVDVAEVLRGTKGTAFYKDYRDVPVLSAFEPVKVGDLTWALVAEIDEAEAFAPINELTRRILVAAAVLIPLIVLLSNWLARLFVKPIERLMAGTRRIAAGETDVTVKVRAKDEYGELAQAFNQMARSLTEKEQTIQEKIRENDRLLLNILPPGVANRLKRGEQQIADTYSNISVLYAEIEGFNELSAQLRADEAIVLLNELVEAFDEATDLYGVEKLKTIGNAYVAVCGLSVPRIDHTKRMMDFATAILRLVRQFNQRHGTHLSLDIGLDSGAIVAGIVGKSKFIYDVLGDALNIARTIHASPEQNVIQVTQTVYTALSDLYPFERVSDVPVKGKGSLPIWAVKPLDEALDSYGPQTQSAAPSEPAPNGVVVGVKE